MTCKLLPSTSKHSYRFGTLVRLLGLASHNYFPTTSNRVRHELHYGAKFSSNSQAKTLAEISAMKKSADGKLNKINQRLNNIDSKMAAIQKDINHQTKLQALAFAIENSEIYSFQYYQYQDDNTEGYAVKAQSADLVRDVLLNFRRGYGYILPKGTMSSFPWGHTLEEQAKSNTKFHAALVARIHTLTGTKPRVEEEDDGSFVIYYS